MKYDDLIDHTMPIPESGCWIWMRSVNSQGYGTVPAKGKSRLVHRIFYEQAKGPIPHGLIIDHLCRVRSCCNPDHLEAVTSKENTRRGLMGVLRTHCAMGHPFADDNLALRNDGGRLCLQCRRDRVKKYKQRRAQKACDDFVRSFETEYKTLPSFVDIWNEAIIWAKWVAKKKHRGRPSVYASTVPIHAAEALERDE